MQQTGIFAGRTEVRCPYARWGWTRGGGKVWHGGLDLAGLDDATIRMPYYKGKRITGRVTRARIVTDRRDKTWEWGYYVCVQLDHGQTPDAVLAVAVANLPGLGLEVNGVVLPVVLVWYIFTELGSIAENAAAMGAPVPGWLVRILAQGKEGAKK